MSLVTKGLGSNYIITQGLKTGFFQGIREVIIKVSKITKQIILTSRLGSK